VLDTNPNKRPEMDEVVKMLKAVDISEGGGTIPLDQPQVCEEVESARLHKHKEAILNLQMSFHSIPAMPR